MDIRDLMYLEASAVAGNFTRAAKSLGLQTSTVSRRVGRAEDELGVTLFERNHTGIRLTAGGKAVLPHIRGALAELDALRKVGEQAGSGLSGEVRMALRIPPLGEPLRSLLADWHQQHQGVGITIYEMNELEIRTALRERRIDVALVTGRPHWPDAASMQICRERLCVALPRAHPLTRRRRIGWPDIRSETVLVQGLDNAQLAREFYSSFVYRDVPFVTVAAGLQCVLALVAVGQGITLVTKSLSQVVVPGVAYRPICEDNAWAETKLIWTPTAEDPVVGRFVAFMRDQARSRKLF